MYSRVDGAKAVAGHDHRYSSKPISTTHQFEVGAKERCLVGL
jgi:hypothetical protein